MPLSHHWEGVIEPLIRAARPGVVVEIGVAQGMSGSPVFVDGKLVGAISTTWSMTKEPMLGITPVEQMVQEADSAEKASSAGRRASEPGSAPLGDHPGSASPIGSPLVLSQFDPRLVAVADSVFRPWGFTVTEGGALGGEERGGTIEPGATLAGSRSTRNRNRGLTSMYESAVSMLSSKPPPLVRSRS